RGLLRRVPARHRGARRRCRLARWTRHRADLAALVESDRLHDDARAGGTLHPFLTIFRHPALAPFLCGRYRGRARVRESGLPLHAPDPDGPSIRIPRPGTERAAGRRVIETAPQDDGFPAGIFVSNQDIGATATARPHRGETRMRRIVTLGLALGLSAVIAGHAVAQIKIGVGGPMTGGGTALCAALRHG